MMTLKPVLYLTGGGTGGHLFPGIAIATRWSELHPETEIIFVGSEREGERRILVENGFRHLPLAIESGAMLRRNPIRFGWRGLKSLYQAERLLRQHSCLGIVGLGGFASGPLLLAARRRGLPYLLLEQNAIPGRANRAASRGARGVCCAYEEAVSRFPRGTHCIVTGNPVRQEIAGLATSVGPGVSVEGKRLLVLGGSLGSEGVNTLMLAAAIRIPELREWEIVHQTGEKDCSRVRETYASLNQRARVLPFIADIVPEYLGASCAVTRGGGVTLSELSCAGIPSLIVPLPTATDGHQLANAKHFEQLRAAMIVEQQAPVETIEAFVLNLGKLLTDPELRKRMGSNFRSAARANGTDLIVAEMERQFPVQRSS